jgi:hypothetical protein
MYAVATLPSDGMIRYDFNNRVHHRESIIPVEIPDFDTLEEVQSQLTGDAEEFIIEFNRERVCEALWIPREHEPVFTQRLRRWRGCYGGYDTKYFRAS